MSKIQKLYNSNLLFHFWISYLIVLLIPVCFIIFGALGEVHVVKKDILASNLRKMEHSIQLIDSDFDVIESIAAQCTSSPSIKAAASLNHLDGSSMLKFKNSVDTLSNITKYQKNNFIDEIYLYFNKVDYLFYEESFYRQYIFQSYLDDWGITREEWMSTIVNPQRINSQYLCTSNSILNYIMPLNIHYGGNDGTAVFQIHTEEFLNYFSFTEEYGDYALYITDSQQNLLYQYDASPDRTVDFLADSAAERFPDVPEGRILSTVSPKLGWNYYILLPENVIENRLLMLCISASLLGGLTILVGLLLSLYQTLRMGRPIDQLFTLVDEDSNTTRSSEKLGEIVAGIFNSNKALQTELEENKPLLKKAFFHDLITLDVTSSKELSYLAANADINLDSDRFRIASVRLFANNDFYNVDEQTLLDVKVILQTLQIYLEEHSSENVWFYQRNYLSLLVVFEGSCLSDLMALLTETSVWLRTTFSTESDWGLSSECNNIMNLWKYCEEAETARDHCQVQEPVVLYRPEFEDKHAFYFPEAAEEKLENCIRSGDHATLQGILAILEQENIQNRHLGRKGFIKLNGHITNLLAQFERIDAGVLNYIMQLNQIVLETEPISLSGYFSTLRDVCTLLCRNSNKEKGIQRNLLIEQIQQYILENYKNSNLGLSTISIQFRISEGYVSTLFKEHTQTNFTDYVESIRLTKACELLKESDHTIEEIALMVGYNSVHSFRRAFKRVYGETPRNYR